MSTGGRVAVVTGAAQGIGRATAARLVADGCRVVLADLNGLALEESAAVVDPSGTATASVVVDVADRGAVDGLMAQAVERFGGIDVLVTSAGTPSAGAVASLADEDWMRTVDVHLGGTMRCARAAQPALARSAAGAVVAVSSLSGLMGMAGRAAYAASKGGVAALVRTLAVEWAPDGVRVNAVAPGPVLTDRFQGLADAGTYDLADFAARIPLGRLARPEQVAGAIAFLASRDAGHVTGQVLAVDGGESVAGKG